MKQYYLYIELLLQPTRGNDHDTDESPNLYDTNNVVLLVVSIEATADLFPFYLSYTMNR